MKVGQQYSLDKDIATMNRLPFWATRIHVGPRADVTSSTVFYLWLSHLF